MNGRGKVSVLRYAAETILEIMIIVEGVKVTIFGLFFTRGETWLASYIVKSVMELPYSSLIHKIIYAAAYSISVLIIS